MLVTSYVEPFPFLVLKIADDLISYRQSLSTSGISNRSAQQWAFNVANSDQWSLRVANIGEDRIFGQ